MIRITEFYKGNENMFKYDVIENGSVILSEDISYSTIIRRINEKDYFLIYDSELKAISDSFKFINYYKEKHAFNSKVKCMQALKLLFVFQKIISKNLFEFNTVDINNLKHFLRGITPNGSIYFFNLKTVRKNETINGYLAIYRQYFKFLGIENSELMRRTKSVLISHPDSEVNFHIDNYTSNEKVPQKVTEVPWYISVEDFDRIITEIRTNYSIVEELIVRLMFQCGLRIGEVLGLTGEDLLIENINYDFIPVAYIRNRLSDTKDQKAKTCMKVFSKNDYKTKEYKTFGFGHQKVIIPYDLYNHINEYIEEQHVKARNLFPGRYYSSSLADKVVFDDEDNYYIFLNTQYRPLSSQSWNIRLRAIFKAVGIPVDLQKREHNLNHRFRHGFAMFHVQHLKYNALELKERMRHNSISSVSKYYKPTIIDSIKIKTDFANNLYDLIPSLKKGLDKND